MCLLSNSDPGGLPVQERTTNGVKRLPVELVEEIYEATRSRGTMGDNFILKLSSNESVILYYYVIRYLTSSPAENPELLPI
jgi:hypothetical protein